MARSVGYCAEHHQVIAFFGWDCPLCSHVCGKPFTDDPERMTLHDLRRAVVNDYNRIFFFKDDPLDIR
jgi:hypothetical protein